MTTDEDEEGNEWLFALVSNEDDVLDLYCATCILNDVMFTSRNHYYSIEKTNTINVRSKN